MQHHRFFKPLGLLFFVAVATVLSGCANGAGNNIIPVNYEGQQSIVSSTSGLVGNGFDCPENNNIMGASTGDLSNYTACQNLSSESQVLLEGVGSYSSEVCVFAAMTSGNNIFPVYSSSGSLAVTCVSMSGAEAQLSFSGVSFNSLYVVDQSDENTMYTCLADNEPDECPEYAFGEFR
jgi:hypothetical protein